MPPTSGPPTIAASLATIGAAPSVRAPRPVIQATAPERYRVQFTIGQETHDKLRRLQALLRREVPDGDTGAIFDRAVSLLLDKVERDKLGATAKPRPRPSIRPGTDNPAADNRSRNVPREVKRAVWRRDVGQCAFVSSTGHRCTERTFLEFHHVQPYAMRAPATVANISLRCHRHNQYEAELIFGPQGGSMVRDGAAPFGALSEPAERLLQGAD